MSHKEFREPDQHTAESRVQDLKKFAVVSPLDAQKIWISVAALDACAKAIEYNEYLKRRARRDKIEKVLGFQRHILQWVFNAKKIKGPKA